MADLTVTQLAMRLGVTSRRARGLVADGSIAGRQLPSGDWLADSDSLARYQIRRKPPGRNLDPATAWAILYELSGIRAASLLPPATYARVRERIRKMGADSLVTAVASRTTTHRFRSANADKAQVDLIRTARAASDLIASDLLPDTRRVQGYVPAGTSIVDYARAHFMIEDPTGADALYENTAPGGLHEPLPAVVAADLALSTDTRERSAGIQALETLRNEWLATHTH
jgi:hypothetical protein